MKIIAINQNNKAGSIQFQRKPSPSAMKYYTSSISEGLRVLDKEVGLIIHNSSVPSQKGVNLGIGSLLSILSEKLFMPFVKSHGMTKVLQDPTFIRKSLDNFSPYDPLSTSKNIFMIPLERLASEEYGGILSKVTLKNIVARKEQENNPDNVNYLNMSKEYDVALNEAYTRFIMRTDDRFTDSSAKPKQIEKAKTLAIDFDKFKVEKREELEPNAIYEILSKKYGEEDWKKWDEIDRNLYDSPQNAERLQQLKEENADEIDFYMFKQWLAEREIAKTNKRNKKLGIDLVADTPIAFTPAEEWLHKDLFIEGLSLGCPPDFFSSEGQRWGFAVINPKKLFNPDGTLGKGGEFLKKRYEDIFKSSPGGVRIDHLIGLIDPFVYAEDEPHMTNENSGRLYTSPWHARLRDYTKFTDEEFAAIFEKIIFPAAEKYGITKDNIICEDLGYVTETVKRIMNKLNLTGMSLTQYGYSGVDTPAKNVIMLGGHDNKSYIEFTDDLFARSSSLGEGRDRFMFKTHILGSDTVVPGKDVNMYREELRSDKKKFMAASFAELFTSPAKKVHIFFTDFFGIGKTYNVPGAKKGCWELRAPENFEDLYYKNLSEGIGLNLPEAIATAIRQKGTDFSNQHKNLLRKLDFFTNILKEK